MKRKLIALALVMPMVLLSLAIVPAPAGAAPLTKTDTVYHNQYERISIGSVSNSYTGKVTVTANATIDVYILDTTGYSGYPESFTPVKAVEKTKNANFEFKAQSGTAYYLIIDNVDNGRTSDQKPAGDVEYSATYPNILDQLGEEVETAAWTCIGIVVAIIVIIIVVIVLIIFLVARKKKPPAQPVPAYSQPYQQPPAQPYQQQPYQQPPPSQYEPPPPTPYQPPPPPPY